MRYYPINLDVQNKVCLVVGAGEVGERKVRGLLRSGATVVVVSPEASDSIKGLASEGLIELQLRPYASSDLTGKFLVVGATNEEKINSQISHDALKEGILCNIADRPAACNFVLPAVVERGDLLIAVSTSNKSPAVAKAVRKKLENVIGPEYGTLVMLMGAIRDELIARGLSPEANKKKFEQLLESGLVELIENNRICDIDEHLRNIMGEGFTWTDLMKDHPAMTVSRLDRSGNL